MNSYLSLPEYVSASHLIQQFHLEKLNYIQNQMIPILASLPNPIIIVIIGLKPRGDYFMFMDALNMASELNPEFNNYPSICITIKLTNEGIPIDGPLYCDHTIEDSNDIDNLFRVFNEYLPNTLEWDRNPNKSIIIHY